MGGRGAGGFARLLPLAATALLAACGGPAGYNGSASGSLRSGIGHYTVGRPYEVKGVWYYPHVDYHYDETGVASWYGEQFNGRLTANGEIFDLNQLTAAHRTLPLPSVVEVTNLDNGRTMRLRVNDRGPFADGRILDVSRRAAQLLGFEGAGTARVRVRILKDESIQVAQAAMRNGGGSAYAANALNAATVASLAARRPQPPPLAAAAPRPPRPAPMTVAELAPEPQAAAPRESAFDRVSSLVVSPAAAATLPPAPVHAKLVMHEASGRIFIQAGAFAVAENARRVRARIAPLGHVEVLASSANGRSLYRVRLGPVATKSEADKLLIEVIGSGYPGARIVTD
ncbi:MAG TPA: septal ring lytic transglycosylase RlpA family protein [Stellaceae bacterium]|nr:septal ring lytic transglycosylase RlpA family protein [Stellaceae bacterium]